MESIQHDCELNSPHGSPPPAPSGTYCPPPNPAKPTRQDHLDVVAQMAVAGLHAAGLPLEDYARFYEGLGAILSSPGAESALYAATCIAEFLRAQRDVRSAVKPSTGARP
jgi:hypothetical protein